MDDHDSVLGIPLFSKQSNLCLVCFIFEFPEIFLKCLSGI